MGVEIMVNPFRKSFVTRVSELNRIGLTSHIGIDPKDERVPIGPGDVISMHGRNTDISQAPQPVYRQSRLYALNVFIVGVVKRVECQVGRLVAQGHVYSNLIIHGGIFIRRSASSYSLFPVVDFVHSCNVNAAAN